MKREVSYSNQSTLEPANPSHSTVRCCKTSPWQQENIWIYPPSTHTMQSGQREQCKWPWESSPQGTFTQPEDVHHHSNNPKAPALGNPEMALRYRTIHSTVLYPCGWNSPQQWKQMKYSYPRQHKWAVVNRNMIFPQESHITNRGAIRIRANRSNEFQRDRINWGVRSQISDPTCCSGGQWWPRGDTSLPFHGGKHWVSGRWWTSLCRLPCHNVLHGPIVFSCKSVWGCIPLTFT